MKIHFFGSLTGNTMMLNGKSNYQTIVDYVEKLGHKIITKHYVNKKLEEVLQESEKKHSSYIKKMKHWLKSADIVVVEVTKPEIGTGYELALAVDYGKPVIALYANGQNSPVLAGQETDQIQHLEYDRESLYKILEDSLEDASEQMDVRFNFFISPKIGTYLDWVAKNLKLPRAVYLRRLIEEDMKKNKEFKG